MCQAVSRIDTMPAFVRTRSVQRGVWERDGQTGMGTKYGCTHQRKLPAGGEAVFFNVEWGCGTKEVRNKSGHSMGFHFHTEQDRQH